MADNNIDEEVEQIKKQLLELGIIYDDNINNLKKSGKSEKDAIKETKKLATTFAESAKLYKKSALEIDASIKGFKKSIANGEASVDDLADQLSTLRDQINKTSDQDKKQSLLNAKADLEAMHARNQANKALKDGAWSMAGALTVGVAKAFTGAAGKALAGGDSFDVATSMMTAGVDLINTANQGGANALKTFGSATAGAGGKIGLAGAAASALGEGLSAASTGLSELAKAGIGFMLAQTKQLIAGFQSMSAAGAVYSGGMTAMTDTALSAHMTLEQFSKAVSANTVNLAKTGLGVGEASKRMAAAMQKGGDAARNGMFALGLGMEEQADAYANTMALMAGPSGKLKSSNAEVAEQTQEYAKNLKIISTLTGEDVKAKQEKIRQENDTLFMKQKLDEMEPKQRAKFNDMLLTMNDDQRRQLTERMKYGGVISKDLGASEALSGGFRSAGDKFAQAWKNGTASAEVGRKIQADSAEQIKKDAKEQSSLSIANSDIAIGTSKVLAGAWTTSASLTKEGVKAAEEAAKAEQEKGKAGQGGTAVDLMAQQQDMAVKMQALAITHLPAFSNALQETYKAAMWAVESLNDLATAATNNPIKSGLAALLPAVIGMIGPMLLTKMFGGKFGVLGATAANPMHTTSGFGGPGSNRPNGPGGPGSRYEAPHPSSGPGGPGSRYEAPKGKWKQGVTAAKGLAKDIKAPAMIGAAISAGMLYSDISNINEKEKSGELTKQQAKEEKGAAVGSTTGAVVGTAAGTAVGSIVGGAIGAVFGGVGAVPGAYIGGLLGGAVAGWLGAEGGEQIGRAITKEDASKKIAEPTVKAKVKNNAEVIADMQAKAKAQHDATAKLTTPVTNPWGAAYPTKPIAGAILGATLTKNNAANKKIAAVGPELSKKEMYEVNGQPVDKATYDKYLKDNPQLANMMNRANSLNQTTAPKPLASQMSQNLAAEQAKIYGTTIDKDAAVKKAMEKPVASANPAEQQQITLLQSILASLQKNNHISSGILQNSY